MDFSATIWAFYEKNKRAFPWRETTDPYAILVSEIMLQQTQTYRVLPKYLAWLRLFPTVKALAAATLLEVLRAWSGLGYNRRAKFLLEAAKNIVAENNGSFPATYAELVKLPGIGEYTANAIFAFAYNQPTIVLETNIRTAIIHHFFEKEEKVSDKQIKAQLELLIAQQKDPRNWYYALMDYGSWLKSEGIDYFHKQKSYTKQKPFKGSERFVRGWILKELTLKSSTLAIMKIKLVGYKPAQIRKIVEGMEKEKMIQYTNGIIRILG